MKCTFVEYHSEITSFLLFFASKKYTAFATTICRRSMSQPLFVFTLFSTAFVFLLTSLFLSVSSNTQHALSNFKPLHAMQLNRKSLYRSKVYVRYAPSCPFYGFNQTNRSSVRNETETIPGKTAREKIEAV